MDSLTRDTRRRQAIRAVLENAPRPLTVAEIHAIAQRGFRRLAATTVYRLVHALEAMGQVNAVAVPGETIWYELSRSHHHHFFCRFCRRIFDIPCDGHPQTNLRAPLFQIDEQQVIVFGRCVECAGDGAQADSR